MFQFRVVEARLSEGRERVVSVFERDKGLPVEALEQVNPDISRTAPMNDCRNMTIKDENRDRAAGDDGNRRCQFEAFKADVADDDRVPDPIKIHFCFDACFAPVRAVPSVEVLRHHHFERHTCTPLGCDRLAWKV